VIAVEMRYEVELPAAPAAVATARHAASQFGDFHEADSKRIGLAVSEAVANVVLHAYPGEATGPVQVTGWANDDTVHIAVRDFGIGLNANPGRRDGWGLSIIQSVADHVFIGSTEFGFEIVMRFDRPRTRAMPQEATRS
jgi:anti-sigma regulatory factor (Ser/Thr protein kinase)